MSLGGGTDDTTPTDGVTHIAHEGEEDSRITSGKGELNAGQPDVEWYLMVYPPCYAGKTRITMVVINRTATGRGLQTIWTLLCGH